MRRLTRTHQAVYGLPIFSKDDEQALIDVLHSERWFMGDRKEAFEKAFAQYQEAEFGVAVNSGATALQIAQAAGVGLGDEVIAILYVCCHRQCRGTHRSSARIRRYTALDI